MKSEPDEFSIEDLKRVKHELWSGVRGYQARNYMMREMQVGDLVLFYHSSCPEPGIYGHAKVSKLASVDQSQFDPTSPYYDPKATKAQPRWYGVTVTYLKTLKKPVLLSQMKANKKLKDMLLFKNGRLSVSPVSKSEFDEITRQEE